MILNKTNYGTWKFSEWTKYKIEMNVAIQSQSNDKEKLDNILWHWVREK